MNTQYVLHWAGVCVLAHMQSFFTSIAVAKLGIMMGESLVKVVLQQESPLKNRLINLNAGLR